MSKKDKKLLKELKAAQAYSDFGIKYYKQGEYKKALKELEAAREFLKKNNLDNNLTIKVAEIDQNIGIVLNALKRYEDALNKYESARKVYVENNITLDVAEIDLGIGTVLAFSDRYEEALEKYESARKVYVDNHLTLKVAEIDQNIGGVLAFFDRYEEALKRYESARKVYVDNELTLKVAEIDQNIGSVLHSLDQFEKALNRLQVARKLCEDNKLPIRLIAGIDHNTGSVLHSLDRYEEALERYESARKVYVDNELTLKVAEIDQNIGGVLTSLERYEDALNKYESARKLCEDNNPPIRLIAGIDQNIANVLNSLKRYEEALRKYESARKLYEDNKLGLKVAGIDQNIGNVDFKLGRCKKALERFEAVRKVFQNNNLKISVAHMDKSIGTVLGTLGLHEEALNKYESARKVYLDNNLTLDIAKIDSVIGTLLENMDRYKEAYGRFKQAIEAVREHKTFFKNDKNKTDFLGLVLPLYKLMIDLCLKQGKIEEALEYTEEIKSQNFAEKLAHKNLEPSSVTPKELTDRYKSLNNKLNGITFRIGRDDNPENRERFYKELPVVEKELDEVLQKIQKYDPEFDPFFKKRIKMEEITALIPDDATAIIEILPFKDQTALFVIRTHRQTLNIKSFFKYFKNRKKLRFHNNSALVNLGYGYKQLNPEIKKIINHYESYKNSTNNAQLRKASFNLWTETINNLLETLYKQIFAKAKEHLDGIKHIIFIPYGALHLVPLQAMFYKDEEGKRHYLIDDYTVSFAPSAAILQNSMKRKEVSDDNKGKVVIARANLIDKERGLSYLKYSGIEADRIKKFYPESEREYQDCVKKDIFKSCAKDAEILHYIGHGSATSLELYDTKLDMTDIFAEYRMKKCKLTVLSACETGITKLGTTDEHISISSAFLYAGASTVVSSLWIVDDAATCILMCKMYENIKDGFSAAEGLRQAQIWLRDKSKKDEHQEVLRKIYINSDSDSHNDSQSNLPTCLDYDSIYYWAGFIASGNFAI